MRTVRQLLAAKPAEIFAIAPDAAVIDAVRLMAEKGIGAVLAMTGARLDGILSERDYARKIVLEGKSSKDTPVQAIMTAEVVTVAPADTVADCMQLMTLRRIRPRAKGSASRILKRGSHITVVVEPKEA